MLPSGAGGGWRDRAQVVVQLAGYSAHGGIASRGLCQAMLNRSVPVNIGDTLPNDRTPKWCRLSRDSIRDHGRCHPHELHTEDGASGGHRSRRDESPGGRATRGLRNTRVRSCVCTLRDGVIADNSPISVPSVIVSCGSAWRTWPEAALSSAPTPPPPACAGVVPRDVLTVAVAEFAEDGGGPGCGRRWPRRIGAPAAGRCRGCSASCLDAFDVAVRDLPHDAAGVQRLGGGGDQACDVRAVDH